MVSPALWQGQFQLRHFLPHPVARLSGEAAHGLGLAAGVSMGVGCLQPCPQGERKSPRESTPKTPGLCFGLPDTTFLSTLRKLAVHVQSRSPSRLAPETLLGVSSGLVRGSACALCWAAHPDTWFSPACWSTREPTGAWRAPVLGHHTPHVSSAAEKTRTAAHSRSRRRCGARALALSSGCWPSGRRPW